MPNPNLPNNPGYNFYRGARYVPKFSKENGGQWTNTIAYEPLTIVLNQGNSYTSKTYVPVGVDISNEEYWIQTGNFNGQIESLRENLNGLTTEVTDLSRTVLELSTRKIIMIGDSYGEQNDGSISTFFWKYFQTALGLPDSNFYHGFKSGAGFGNGEYLNSLTEIAAMISDKNSITDIFVCGGWNDSDLSQPYGTDAAFNNGVNAFKNYCLTNFKNAKLTLAHISWGDPQIKPEVYSQMPVSIKRYQNQGSNGFRVLTGTEYILHRYNSGVWQADGAHPSQLGQGYLGIYLPSAFLAGSCNPFDNYDRAMISAYSGWTGATIRTFETFANGEYCVSMPNHYDLQNNAGGEFKCDGSTYYDLIGSDYVLGKGNKNENSFTTFGRVYTSDNKWYNAQFKIRMNNNLFGVAISVIDENGVIEQNRTLKVISIPSFNLTLPFNRC